MDSSKNQKYPPRQEMIDTAVAFLKQPRVQSSPLKFKQEFLRGKGLTEEEVEISCEVAGAFINPDNQEVPTTFNRYTVVRYDPYSRFWWLMASGFSVSLVTIGVYYISIAIYKKYLSKYFDPEPKDRKSIRDYQSDMFLDLRSELNEKLFIVESKLSDLDIKLNKLVYTHTNDLEPQSNYKQIEDLKNEVLSLKRLLLSRKQFPNPPSSSLTCVPPSIPAWQLESTESCSNKNSPDHSEGSDPEIIIKDTGSNGSDSSMEIVNK